MATAADIFQSPESLPSPPPHQKVGRRVLATTLPFDGVGHAVAR
jgi:hypothetical protein